MTKNSQKIRFQCNQSLVRARGLFLGVGYKSYTYLLNFPQWNFTILNFPLFYFTLCKVFVFLCNLCNLWLYPKPALGYTGIEVYVTFVTNRALSQA